MAKRILCLHGFSQNGSLFAKKTSGLRKTLQKAGYELHFLDGPLKLEPSDLIHPVSDDSQQEEMLGWWPHNEANPKHLKIDDALSAVKKCIEKHGPFLGIIGFSQGAGLGAVLSSIWTSQIDPLDRNLSFVVLYSGFKVTPKEYQGYFEPKIAVPSLHIMGSLDTVVAEERSELLADCFENPTIIIHPGGHFVPNSKQQVGQVTAFIEHCAKIQGQDRRQDGINNEI